MSEPIKKKAAFTPWTFSRTLYQMLNNITTIYYKIDTFPTLHKVVMRTVFVRNRLVEKFINISFCRITQGQRIHICSNIRFKISFVRPCWTNIFGINNEILYKYLCIPHTRVYYDKYYNNLIKQTRKTSY